MKRFCLALILLIAASAFPQSQDVLGAHDLSSGGNTVRGAMSSACLYCHAPHTGVNKGPLWSQQLSNQVYPQLYQSDTLQNTQIQPPIGENSSLCLSCHDGTVAPGQTAPYGPIQMSQPMSNGLVPNLAASHPFSLKLPMKDAANLVPSLASTGTTVDPTKSVSLIKGNVECSSCHNPHNQKVDPKSPNFLVRDNTNGALCLSCHDVSARTVNTIENPLQQWTNSIHAKSGSVVSISAGFGGYNTVAEYACNSCHVPHNAGGAAGLLRTPTVVAPNIDLTSQSCVGCHNGSNTLLEPILNVVDVMAVKGHPYANDANKHSPAEDVVPNQNRHATCADCHNAHAAQQTVAFNDAPGLRPSQNGVLGVAADGSKLTGPAANQYENCLRCHGNSTGKQALTNVYGYLPVRAAFGGDQLNLINQFGPSAISTHPVMRDAAKINQPSLLSNMWDLSGVTKTRVIGSRILCTDCHNSDNNREFGGNGPNGPHGSNNDHILERQYLISQVTPGTYPTGGPGSPITNLVQNLQPGDSRLQPNGNGPFAMCAKCHDLNSIMSDQSFTRHSLHLTAGISCSACHSAHGVPVGSANVSGERLVNFDVNVVAPYNGVLSYSGGSCTLTCHTKDHNNIK